MNKYLVTIKDIKKRIYKYNIELEEINESHNKEKLKRDLISYSKKQQDFEKEVKGNQIIIGINLFLIASLTALLLSIFIVNNTLAFSMIQVLKTVIISLSAASVITKLIGINSEKKLEMNEDYDKLIRKFEIIEKQKIYIINFEKKKKLRMEKEARSQKTNSNITNHINNFGIETNYYESPFIVKNQEHGFQKVKKQK